MKVHGDLQPSTAFTVEPMPDRPGYCLARFFENAEPQEAGWIYDEYHLELLDTGGMQSDIEANFDVYFEAAKAKDAELSPEEVTEENLKLRGKVQELSEQLDAVMLAMCDVYELALGGEA